MLTVLCPPRNRYNLTLSNRIYLNRGKKYSGRGPVVDEPRESGNGGEFMQPRIDYTKYAPEALKAMLALEKYISECGLDHKLIHLMKMRASQINGCAYCIDMHSIDARALGETEQRLYELDAWRETPFFSDRERAALEWTEAITLVSETHVPDAVFEGVKKYFSEKEIVDLTIVATTINMWNRMAISMRAVPGRYHPAKSSAASS
jgi:AhpD family alkylhydroperoxidase